MSFDIDLDDQDTILPKARVKDIVVQTIANETLVYDVSTDKAHNLSKISALVWKNCDGQTTVGELIELLSIETATEIGTDFVWVVLSELRSANLLEGRVVKKNYTDLTRRKVLMRYALPAIFLPAVLTLVAPESVDAQSCLGAFQTDCCVTPCCPGLFCGNAVGVLCPGQCMPIIN